MPVPRARLGLVLAVVVLATCFATGNSFAEDTSAAPPLDYIAQASKLSQPVYTKTITETLPQTAADGTRLFLSVTRPDPELYGEGPWPVILEASPYHGTLHIRTGTRIFPDPLDAYGRQAGLTGYFAPRGYAVAMMDLRGTGRSTGCLDHLGAKDGADMKQVIEWLADQGWSNGRVGMTGHSYVGSTPIVAAAQNPDGLATIVPSAGLGSMYNHQFQMGVPYNLQWIGPMVAYEQLALERDLPPSNQTGPQSGGRMGDNWESSPNTGTGCGMQNSAVLAGSGQVTGQYESWHAARDFDDEALAADLPIFMVHGVNDNAARIPAAEWFFGGRFMQPGDKVWLGNWDHGSTNGRCGDPNNARALHPNCRFDQWKYALHAWFDHHLAQRTWTDENGAVHEIDTGPAVEAFLNGREAENVATVVNPTSSDDKVYTANGWDQAGAQLSVFPDTGSTLSFQAPATAGSATLNSGAMAVAATVSAGTLTFTSAPLENDTLFLGVPELDLHASVSTGEAVHLVATLARNDGSGPVEHMTTCAIQPQLREGINKITPVIPQEEMSLPMDCFTMAHWVPRGQSLVLTVRTTGPHHATFGGDPRITVFTGPDDSELTLPVIPNATLYDDVAPLREPVTPVTFPIGQPQPGASGTVTLAPGGGLQIAPFAAPIEFEIEEGYDNATITTVATPARGDVDLYLQQLLGEEWATVDAEESSNIANETMVTTRQPPGHYRILIANFAATPGQVTYEITFRNQQGQSGGSGGSADAGKMIRLGKRSTTTGRLPLR